MMNSKRIIALLLSTTVVLCLSGCATTPSGEKSAFVKTVNWMMQQYNVHRKCKNKNLRTCNARTIARHEKQKQKRKEKKLIAQGELIPVEDLPASLDEESRSSVPTLPDTFALTTREDYSVVIKPESRVGR